MCITTGGEGEREEQPHEPSATIVDQCTALQSPEQGGQSVPLPGDERQRDAECTAALAALERPRASVTACGGMGGFTGNAIALRQEVRELLEAVNLATNQ